MCFNGNYKSYAIDPEDWDKYVVFKTRGTDITKKEPEEGSGKEDIEDPVVENDNRLSVGVK